MRIALRYCGACNPEVDLARVGCLVAELVPQQGWQVVTPGENAGADVLVLLCGCPRTCIDKEKIRCQVSRVVVMAGKRLGWRTVKEEDLPRAVLGAIQELSPP